MAFKEPIDFVNESQGLMEGISKWAYEVTGGWFWALLLMGFCIVLYMATTRFGDERAIGYAAVVGLLGSIILMSIGLMEFWLGSIFIIVGAIGLAWMIMSKRNN